MTGNRKNELSKTYNKTETAFDSDDYYKGKKMLKLKVLFQTNSSETYILEKEMRRSTFNPFTVQQSRYARIKF